MTTWTHEKLSHVGADASHVVAGTHGPEEGSQHLFYSGADSSIHELSWKGRGERRERSLGGGGGQLASHAVAAENTQHVFSVGALSHVWEIYWTGGEATRAGDLMPDVMENVLLAVGGLASHVTPDGTQHVFYTTILNHLMELAWRGSESPRLRELTTLPLQGPAPLVETRPSTFFVIADGTHHVIYGSGAHVVEMTWSGRDGLPEWRDLTMLAGPGTPLAASRPVAHTFDAEGTQHAFFFSEDGQVMELWWRGRGRPQLERLTERSGGPLAYTGGGPVSHVFVGDGAQGIGTQHVFYRTSDGGITELWWEGAGSVTPENLLVRAPGAPPALLNPADPISHVVVTEHTQHVFYYATDGAVSELWSQP